MFTAKISLIFVKAFKNIAKMRVSSGLAATVGRYVKKQYLLSSFACGSGKWHLWNVNMITTVMNIANWQMSSWNILYLACASFCVYPVFFITSALDITYNDTMRACAHFDHKLQTEVYEQLTHLTHAREHGCRNRGGGPGGTFPRTQLTPVPGRNPERPNYTIINENGPFSLLLDCFSAIALVALVVLGPLSSGGSSIEADKALPHPQSPRSYTLQ